MDTGTHVVMGFALGGLAMVDPVVASDPVMQKTVLIATIIGSQAPDFDTVLKLRNNAVYLRNHRGITHSIPAVLLWPLLITATLALFVPGIAWATVLLWSFIAVFLHVFVDIFNAYGTQALRPFSKRWVALGVINTFDPYIFFTHLGALMMWLLGSPPVATFFGLYGILILYYIWRFYEKNKVIQHAKRLHPTATHIFVSPSMRWYQWHLVIRTKETLYVAESTHNEINYFEQYPFEPIPDMPIMNAARKDDNLHAFLSFSPTYRWEVEKNDDYTEVRFIDLRYRSKGHYPFVAIVQLNEQLQIISSYTGWVYNENTLRKKLNVLTEN
ncbi:membrane protein [Alkalihalobacillus alcalophilus ATCC 27647 = CGMCC 1.3604]|uniref:Membrane protein n=1 Tax=Alkalihalobacillus alcalophilus ATCC 27647 = CGMCC 1.3604 TaxID=1218173 RepID=A0A094WIS4_ALKAL|nr:metal-dependent hydrolase [Alkalihalobacillus alcalophilus]KGA97694.1 membrane protein [Alkalihalobacillus alcalophilus ATCC 27647 = CGMCC 1.3604]MED1562570.1 metal-dependent hydrolase [Alkalihalobacillus alcalophilus]THG91273.1 membrane protein [Alkalihalobacillus alcalophilus ATCC 27647 = CGMCC 1.3604]